MESQHHCSLHKEEEGGPRKLEASQPHLYPWKGDGTTHYGSSLGMWRKRRLMAKGSSS